MRLTGLTAVVTGGGRGIGRAISLELAQEGADVAVIVRRDLRSAGQTARAIMKLGRRCLTLQADVVDKHSVETAFRRAVREFGQVDVLVNNAGLGAGNPLEKLRERDWDRVVAVNLKGVFLCGVAAARQMIRQKRGTIVNIAAASAHRCYALGGAYGPSKAAVISLTKQMAVEWASHDIRVNGVSPGPIGTLATEQWLRADRDVARRVKKIPLRRIGTPQEVARAVVFLASDDASYVTGQILVVDGGSVETWYRYP